MTRHAQGNIRGLLEGDLGKSYDGLINGAERLALFPFAYNFRSDITTKRQNEDSENFLEFIEEKDHVWVFSDLLNHWISPSFLLNGKNEGTLSEICCYWQLSTSHRQCTG